MGFMVCAPGWLIGSVPGSRTLGWLWDFYQRVWDFCVAFWECVGYHNYVKTASPQNGEPSRAFVYSFDLSRVIAQDSIFGH